MPSTPLTIVRQGQLSRRSLVTAAGLVLAGCGQHKDESSAAQTPPTDGAKGAAPSATAAASNPAPGATKQHDDPIIVAEAMLLPGLAKSANEGPLIDLLRAIGRVYSAGSLDIRASPVARVYDNVTRGLADLGLPTLRLSQQIDLTVPYRPISTAYGRVNFVLYSRKNAKLTLKDVDDERRAQRRFQYKIEAPDFEWGFPNLHFTNFDSAFRKLDAGRIDGLLWAQEEADIELRRLGLKSIHRASYGDFDDTLFVAHGPRGDYVDRVVTQAIERLKQTGELQAIYSKIHRPHDPWQA